MYTQEQINQYYLDRFAKFGRTFAKLLDEATKKEYESLISAAIDGGNSVNEVKDFLKKLYASYDRMELDKKLKEKRFHSVKETAEINARILVKSTITATLGELK